MIDKCLEKDFLSSACLVGSKAHGLQIEPKFKEICRLKKPNECWLVLLDVITNGNIPKKLWVIWQLVLRVITIGLICHKFRFVRRADQNALFCFARLFEKLMVESLFPLCQDSDSGKWLCKSVKTLSIDLTAVPLSLYAGRLCFGNKNWDNASVSEKKRFEATGWFYGPASFSWEPCLISSKICLIPLNFFSD